MDSLDEARAAYEDSDRRYRAARDRLVSIFADIGAKAFMFTAGAWLVFIVPWVPKAEHAEQMAEVAVILALGACLWILSTRFCPHPWADDPTAAGPDGRRGDRG